MQFEFFVFRLCGAAAIRMVQHRLCNKHNKIYFFESVRRLKNFYLQVPPLL